MRQSSSFAAEQELADRLFEKVPGMTSFSVNSNTERTNVIMGRKTRTIRGKDRIEDTIGGLVFTISPQSFYQVNPVQTENIYSQALSYAGLTGNETVWDLYCGIGTISLFLARQAKQVYGVEIVPQAIDDARQNAVRNGIDKAKFYVGKAEEVLPHLYETEGIFADVIVVDPPRKGCDEECLNTILKMRPKRLVYVSCDSATLARDLKYLCSQGYELKCGRAFDNFPMGGHVETVIMMTYCGDKGKYGCITTRYCGLKLKNEQKSRRKWTVFDLDFLSFWQMTSEKGREKIDDNGVTCEFISKLFSGGR